MTESFTIAPVIDVAQARKDAEPNRREVVFDTAADDMWEAVVRGLGIDPNALVPARGIH